MSRWRGLRGGVVAEEAAAQGAIAPEDANIFGSTMQDGFDLDTFEGLKEVLRVWIIQEQLG